MLNPYPHSLISLKPATVSENKSRRNFLKQNTLTGIGAVLLGGLGGCVTGRVSSDGKKKFQGEVTITSIGDMTLEQLRDKYRTELFNRFLPNMDSSVVDHEYGGFMCTVDIRSGKLLDTNKKAWYEGRGIWIYSFLYNNFEKNPRYLEIARKAKDFILKLLPADDRFYPGAYTREGVPLSKEEGDIYGNLFIAEGLAEYAKASGEKQYRELAKKIIFSCLNRYDSSDYRYPFEDDYKTHSGAPDVLAPRIVGHWMIFLRFATQFIEQGADPDIQRLADRCVDAIMNHHLNPDFNLFNECLNHDLSRPDSGLAQYTFLGHGIETLWIVMFEAARKKDVKLFQKAQELFKRHVSVAHDTVYGGYFRSLDQVDNFTFNLDKFLWLQEEVLIGTLFLIEHKADAWAEKCFAETYAYVQEKFAYPNYKFWTFSGDRKMNNYQIDRAEHYHHPRHLMINLLALERMIRRGHKTSGVFG